jgi:putative membrane protein
MKLGKYSTLTIAAMVMAIGTGFAQVRYSEDGRTERIFNPTTIGVGQGADNGRPERIVQQNLNEEDVHFLREAASIETAAIQTNQLAAQKCTDPFLSQYAKEMLKEHQMSLDEVTVIAASKNIPLSPAPSLELQHYVAHLENQSGSNFDAAYINILSESQQMASAELKYEVESGRDDDERALAVKSLPQVFHQHRMLVTKDMFMSTGS